MAPTTFDFEGLPPELQSIIPKYHIRLNNVTLKHSQKWKQQRVSPSEILYTTPKIAQEYRKLCSRHAIPYHEIWVKTGVTKLVYADELPNCEDERLVIKLFVEMAHIASAYEGAGYRKYHREYVRLPDAFYELINKAVKYDKIKYLAVELQFHEVGELSRWIENDSKIAVEGAIKKYLVRELKSLPSLLTYSVRRVTDPLSTIAFGLREKAGDRGDWKDLCETAHDDDTFEQSFNAFLRFMGIRDQVRDAGSSAAWIDHYEDYDPQCKRGKTRISQTKNDGLELDATHDKANDDKLTLTDNRSLEQFDSIDSVAGGFADSECSSDASTASDDPDSNTVRPPTRITYASGLDQIRREQPWADRAFGGVWVGLPLSRKVAGSEVAMKWVEDVVFEEQGHWLLSEEAANERRRTVIQSENKAFLTGLRNGTVSREARLRYAATIPKQEDDLVEAAVASLFDHKESSDPRLVAFSLNGLPLFVPLPLVTSNNTPRSVRVRLVDDLVAKDEPDSDDDTSITDPLDTWETSVEEEVEGDVD